VTFYLDKQQTQDAWFNWEDTAAHRSYCRADTNWNIIYQDIISKADANNTSDTLGAVNGVTGTRTNYNLSNPLETF